MVSQRTLTAAGRLGGVALLLVLSLAASAQAAAPAAVLQLRAPDGRTCTTTLVAARFAVTAAHCVRSPRTSLHRLRVYSRARGKQFAKVAAVVRAPATAGRRPDVALVQLTSPSSRRPARLPGARLVPRRGTAATVSGWSARRRTSRRARLARLQRCGREATRGTLCGNLRGAVPAVRCRDAAGAALTVSRNGKPLLLGIGARSPRGCRRSPQVRFTNLSEPGLRTWIADMIDPGGAGAEPGGTGQPVGAGGGSSPVSFVGSWVGQISEDLPDRKTYRTQVTIEREGTIGETIGRSDYASGTCGGMLAVTATLADGAITVVERLTYGLDRCADGGTITLAHIVGRPAISYSWAGASDDGRSSGVLDRLR